MILRIAYGMVGGGTRGRMGVMVMMKTDDQRRSNRKSVTRGWWCIFDALLGAFCDMCVETRVKVRGVKKAIRLTEHGVATCTTYILAAWGVNDEMPRSAQSACNVRSK